jgi:hypothetical protein
MSVKVIPEKIHLQTFRILNAEIKSPFNFETSKIERFETNSEFDMAFNFEDCMVKADIIVTVNSVSEKDTNEEDSSAIFHLVYIFHVENFKELAIIVKDNILDLKGGLANSLASIVYSTTRGILISRFQGTALADFILPVIDPNILITQSVK